MALDIRLLKSERAEKWRAELQKKYKAKDRFAIPRVKMSEMDSSERTKYQNREVNLGLTLDQAMTEASRCMDCPIPTCMEGCPVSISIPKFIKQLESGEILSAASTLKSTSALPAVCGRVCPQEKQCEAQCFYIQKMNLEPVAIGHLERFVADYERESGTMSVPDMSPRKNIKVAALGSGPASLSFAGSMAQKGYDVTVFEALHEIGGVLKYGIPEFRLPNKIVDVELEILSKMGVKFIPNVIVGRTITFNDLRDQGYKAFFAGVGAGLPRFMDIPGENFNAIMSSNEYLTRVNLMNGNSDEYDTPILRGKNIAVIGGGNTAMDSVRTAIRMGAERAMIIYRRSREEMPARIEEVHHAEEEGVEFINLASPVEYFADEKTGRVNLMRIQHMRLGEPDEKGRRKPIPLDEFSEIPVDIVVVAVGVTPNPLLATSNKEIEMTRWGTIVADENTGQTSVPDVFSGGDIVRGGATVILAMGDGRNAAAAMDKYLTEK